MMPTRIDPAPLLRLLAACAVILQGAGCSDEYVVTEEVGSADYFLDNLTARELTIAWTTVPERGTEVRAAGPVAAGERRRFEQDGAIGQDIVPTLTFAWLQLKDEAGQVVYRQDPIDDRAWDFDWTDTAEYPHANITLTVTEDLLAPQ